MGGLSHALLVAAVAAGALWPAAVSAQKPAIERTPDLFIVRVKAPFDDVIMVLQEAIKRRNYVVTGINNLDEILARRSADIGGLPLGYERYKTVGFCNLTLADAAVRKNPNVGVLFPCRALVYRARGAIETTVVALRPTFLLPALAGSGLERVMQQAEADVLKILEEVVAD